MSSQLYRVVFNGEINRGNTLAQVKRDLAALFQADAEVIEQLFTGRPIVLKQGLDAETAIQYVSAMSRAGAVSRMEPMPAGAPKKSAGFIERRQAERRQRQTIRRQRLRHESMTPDRRAHKDPSRCRRRVGRISQRRPSSKILVAASSPAIGVVFVKFIFKSLLSLFVLLALVAGGGTLFLDGIVRKGIETVGTQVAKVEVKLDDVGMSVFTGKGALRGLQVANPKGYRAPAAVKVGQALVVLKPLSVFSERVVIRSVVVQETEIHYEQRDGKANLDVIQANVESALPDRDKTKPEKKLQIDSLVIRNAKVHVYGDKSDEPPTVLTLNEIHLKDLGQGPEGITGVELTRKLTAAVIKDTLAAMVRGVTDRLKGLFGK